jgi:uncharacterized RDD family membrane protein YckC
MEENTIPSVFDALEKEDLLFEYATTGQRLVNFLIDLIVFYLLNIVVFFALGVYMSFIGGDIVAMLSNKITLYSIVLFNEFVIYTLIEGVSHGRSLGKLITGTRAVQSDFSPITFKQAALRSLCRMIPFEPISGLSNNPWHDSITGTTVIKNNRVVY